MEERDEDDGLQLGELGDGKSGKMTSDGQRPAEKNGAAS